MKTKITIILALFIATISLAQQGINYKAIIKDGAGNIIANQMVAVEFNILEDATLVYQESHTPTTNNDGIIILDIGEGTPLSGTFSGIDWSSNNHSLNVQVNTGGGLQDLGTTAFKTVPYAKQAESANFKTINNVTSNGPGDIDMDDFVFGSTQLDHSQPDEGPVDNRMFFDKSKGAFRAGGTQTNFLVGIFGDVWNENNIGNYSFALGYNTQASGLYSMASGFNSKATGTGSIALGDQLQATGIYSFTAGVFNKTLGNYSVAFGYNNDAKSYGETVFGTNNTDYIIAPNGNTLWNENDRLFVIGNGASSSMPSDALLVLKNGTITAPSYDLAEITDDKALITKEYADTNYNSTNTDAQTLTFNTASEELSITNGNTVNLESINTDAQTLTFNTASKELSITNGNIVNLESINSGLEKLNEGNGNGWRLAGLIPSSYGSIGAAATDLSVSTSNSSIRGATGTASFATGQNTRAFGYGSIAMGNSTYAVGSNAMAIGRNTVASRDSSLALGKWNDEDATALLIVGNGVSTNSNTAFKIIENGDAVFDADVQHTSTGNANMIPIAYGIVESNGDILSGTGNFTAFLSGSEFIIDVNEGQSLSYFNTVCLVTPITTSPRTASTIITDGNGDSDNDISVRIFNSSGGNAPTTFQFVIYKL